MQRDAAVDALPCGCIYGCVYGGNGLTRLLTMKDTALKPSFETRTFKENRWPTERAGTVTEGHRRSLEEWSCLLQICLQSISQVGSLPGL